MTEPSEEEIERARELAKEMLRLLSQRGGRRNTVKQTAARRENVKRARWAKKHPGQPYQGDYR